MQLHRLQLYDVPMPLWQSRADEEQLASCPDCKIDPVKMTAAEAARLLKHFDTLHPQGNYYSFGDHVSDPMALVMRYLRVFGWKFISHGRMWCREHRMRRTDEDDKTRFVP